MQFGRFIPRGEIVKYQQTADENKKFGSKEERERERRGQHEEKTTNNNSHWIRHLG